MRAVISSIATALLVAAAASAQTDNGSAFGARIGARLDSTQCRYFGLFPAFEGVSEARIDDRGPGGARLVVTRRVGGTHADTTLMLSAHQAERLRLYISEFESLFRDPGRIQVDSIRALIRPARPFTGPGGHVRVTGRDGAVHEGSVLHADDSTLVISTDREQYDWRGASSSVTVLRSAGIDRIESSGSLIIGFSAGLLASTAAAGLFYDGLVGRNSTEEMVAGITWGGIASIGAYDRSATDQAIGGNPMLYARVLPEMRRAALFGDDLPPEVTAMMHQPAPTIPPPPESIEAVAGRERITHFSAHYASGMPLYISENRMPVTDYLRKRSGYVGVNTIVSFRRVGLGYDLNAHLGWTAEYVWIPTGAALSEYGGNSNEWFELSTLRATTLYRILAPSPFNGQHLVLTVGVGAGYSPVNVVTTVHTESNDNLRMLRVTRAVSNELGAASAHAMLEIGYQAIRNLSIFAAVDATHSFGVTLPGWSFQQVYDASEPNSPTVQAGSPEHTLTFSSASLVIGVRAHL